jgi:hypothetical protein
MRNPEWDDEQERHKRRLKLMRMQGEINRAEDRNRYVMIAAGVIFLLAVLAGVLA